MLTLFATLVIWSPATLATSPDKTQCRAGELGARDCHLRLREFELDVLDKTLAWTDGTWHSVDPMPLSGEGTEWEMIRFERIQNRPVLQMWIWDKGGGEAAVQSEHWFVAALGHRKLRLLAEGVVRKRRRKEPAADEPGTALTGKSGAAATGSGTGVAPKQLYLYDASEPHGLKGVRDGELEWRLGEQTKKITVGP